MDIEEERKAFEESNNVNPDWSFNFNEELQQYVALDHEMQLQVDEFNEHWDIWRAAWQASANREGFVLVNAEQLNQWGHMANAAEQYGCCECFESRGYAHNLACEISSYFEPTVEQEQSNESN